MMDDSKKQEPPLFLDIPFGEALTRFARTKPEEVEPPTGKKPKVAKAARQLAAFSPAAPSKSREGAHKRPRRAHASKEPSRDGGNV